MSARFDQELGGFVAYQDNGDGTYSPLVRIPKGIVGAGTFAHFAVSAPLTGATVATLTPGAGTWRIEYAFGTIDSGTGKYLQLNVGGNPFDICPAAGHIAGALAAITLGAGASITVNVGQAGGAGNWYMGWIAYYPVA